MRSVITQQSSTSRFYALSSLFIAVLLLSRTGQCHTVDAALHFTPRIVAEVVIHLQPQHNVNSVASRRHYPVAGTVAVQRSCSCRSTPIPAISEGYSLHVRLVLRNPISCKPYAFRQRLILYRRFCPPASSDHQDMVLPQV